MGRMLIILGAVLMVAGLIISFTGGRMPGDIVVRRPGFTFYFPVVTSIVLSVILTLVMWFFQRR
jgi:hypothetical protein